MRLRVFAWSLLLSLIIARPSSAGPRDWLRHQFKDHPLRTQLIFSTAASGVYAYGLHNCRVQNVENCQEHYGAAWGGYASTIGLDLAGVLVGHKIGGKTGNAIAYGGSATLLGWGAYQWYGGLNRPREESKTFMERHAATEGLTRRRVGD